MEQRLREEKQELTQKLSPGVTLAPLELYSEVTHSWVDNHALGARQRIKSMGRAKWGLEQPGIALSCCAGVQALCSKLLFKINPTFVFLYEPSQFLNVRNYFKISCRPSNAYLMSSQPLGP